MGDFRTTNLTGERGRDWEAEKRKRLNKTSGLQSGNQYWESKKGDKMGTLKFVLFVLLRQYVIHSILISNSDVAEDDLAILVLQHPLASTGL